MASEEGSFDEKKLACVTTDSRANIVAAVKKLSWPWLNCFGHNFYLAVTKPMASVKERTARAMGLCHTLVGEFAQVQILQHMLTMVNYKCYDLIV